MPEDRLSRGLHVRCLIYLPHLSLEPNGAGMLRTYANAQLVSVHKGIPRTRGLGSVPQYLPARPLSDEECLEALVGGLKDMLES